jgi:ethanolamine utilization protein EutQ (cupin superfamily)
MQKMSFSKPDETRRFDKGQVELITLGGLTFGRATFHPGWKWKTSVQPIAKTKSCEAPHLAYQISGRLHVVMDDGSEQEFGPGDLALIPPGHDAWVVGDEPVVTIDVSGMTNYAARPA